MGVKRVGNKKNYHREIWQWEVQYEAVQRASVSRDYYLTCTTNVYDFLCAYPDKRTAKEFQLSDVVDYLIGLQRTKGYSHNSCARVGHDIAAFWNWMRRYKDSNLPNMRCDSFETKRMSITALSEAQFLRLVDACVTDEDRFLLREALLGTKNKDIRARAQWTPMALAYRWNRLRKRANVDWVTIRTLSKSYRAMLLRLGAEQLSRLIGARSDVPTPLPTLPDRGGKELQVGLESSDSAS